MGYESTLYIVRKGDRSVYGVGPDEKVYAQVYAKYEMCKFPEFRERNIFNKTTDCYIYADDGNTQIVEDMYGASLTEAPIEKVIDCLEEYERVNDYYCRVAPLLALLKAYVDNGMSNNLVVLHFGH